jgi:hypothetical protein
MVAQARAISAWSDRFLETLPAPLKPHVIGARLTELGLELTVRHAAAATRVKSYRVQLLVAAGQSPSDPQIGLLVRIAAPAPLDRPGRSTSPLSPPSESARRDLFAFAESLADSPLRSALLLLFKTRKSV